jgi:hypothetical protein
MPSLYTAISLAEELSNANEGEPCVPDLLQQGFRVLQILMEASVEFSPRAYSIAVLQNALLERSITYAELSMRMGEDVANAVQLLTPSPQERGLLLSSVSSINRVLLAAPHYPELPAIAIAICIYELEQHPTQRAEDIDACITSAYEWLIPRMEHHLLGLPATMQSALEALLYLLRYRLMEAKRKIKTCYTGERHEHQTPVLRLREYRLPAPAPRLVAHP